MTHHCYSQRQCDFPCRIPRMHRSCPRPLGPVLTSIESNGWHLLIIKTSNIHHRVIGTVNLNPLNNLQSETKVIARYSVIKNLAMAGILRPNILFLDQNRSKLNF